VAVAAPLAVAVPLSWPCRFRGRAAFVAVPLSWPCRFRGRAAFVAVPLSWPCRFRSPAPLPSLRDGACPTASRPSGGGKVTHCCPHDLAAASRHGAPCGGDRMHQPQSSALFEERDL